MAHIVFADSTGHYDGRQLEMRPLGATETSVIYLARELACRGHDVRVLTHCDAPADHAGVHWQPLGSEVPATCDLYVAVQHTELLGIVKLPRRRAIWILWQPNHFEHYRRIWRMWRRQPIPVFTSQYQVRSYVPQLRRPVPEVADAMRNPTPPPPPLDFLRDPFWSLRRVVRIGRLRRLIERGLASLILPRPAQPIVIPLALPDDVRGLPPMAAAPGPRAIFASNPVRNLRRLVEIWATAILPRVPNAVLDVYGIHDLGTRDAWAAWEGTLLPPGLSARVKASVRVHETVSRDDLKAAMRSSRVMLYLGHECEAFCVALAEAQALGVPAVIAPVGALPERVIDGVTGFHRTDPDGFGAAAVSLLTDDALWRRQHEACLRQCGGIGWSEFAMRFETALLGVPPGWEPAALRQTGQDLQIEKQH